MESSIGFTEFGPITPAEKTRGFSLSRFFRNVGRGTLLSSSDSISIGSGSDGEGSLMPEDCKRKSSLTCSQISKDDIIDDANASALDFSETVSTTASSESSSVFNLTSPTAALGHDRNLSNVLSRIKSIIDNKGSVPQQYKDTDFKQYWLPDSVSRQCYECEEKFTTFRRRHHCRVCGQIFCSRCCNRMIPGKIIGFTGELRVCTYCCKVVLSYLQSSSLTPNTTPDLRSLQDDLMANVSSSNAASLVTSPDTGSASAIYQTGSVARNTIRRRISVGFQEEKYVVRTRFLNGEDQGSQVERDQMSAERQLLLRDSQQLYSLWSELGSISLGLPMGSHRHRLKSFPNCYVGRDLVQWLLGKDKASSRTSAVAIGQALVEAGYLVCVSQPEQVFVDDYVLYRPLRPTGGGLETESEELEGGKEGELEPLWVTQISPLGDIEELDSADEDHSYRHDTVSSIMSLSSNYSLDLNVRDSVVSLKKPHNRSSVASQSPQDNRPIPSIGEPDIDVCVEESSLMAEEVLQAIRVQDNKVDLHDGYVNASYDRRALETFQQIWSSHERDLLRQLINLCGVSMSWENVILKIAQEVTETIRPDVKNDCDDMDIKQYVQFKKIPGGSHTDSYIVNGAACTKNLTDRNMSSELTDPQILLIANSIDYQRGNENKLLCMDNLLLQEADYLKNVVAKIVSYKPDIILVEKRIAFLARQFLQEHRIALVMNVKSSVMERVARCAQAEIVSSVDAQLTWPKLGLCHRFYLRSYPLPKDAYAEEQCKTLMFFDGCARHLGCTIVLRGGTNSELRHVKRIAYFMIFAFYNWRLERSFLMDELAWVSVSNNLELDLDCHTPSIELSPMVEKVRTLTQVHSASVLSWGEGGGDEDVFSPMKGHEKRDVSLPPSVPAWSLDRPQRGQVVNDFSDPLHSYIGTSPTEVPLGIGSEVFTEMSGNVSFKQALGDTALSCSPFTQHSVPFLESEIGRSCQLRKFLPKQLYFSAYFDAEATRRVKFSEKESVKCAVPRKKPSFKPPHEFVKAKLIEGANSMGLRSMLADFRARGGQVKIQCPCLDPPTECHTTEKEAWQAVIDKMEPLQAVLSAEEEKFSNETTGDGGFILTNEGKIDALHPFNHQRLSVLFSSFAQSTVSPPDFCVVPWVLTMDFYGRNDIPLGGFLERYCFSPEYSCPSKGCNVPAVNHVRRFVHESGCIEVLLRQLDSKLDENDTDSILTWSWCKVCRQVSSVVPLSADSWSWSFAKYLELHFYGSNFSRRGAGDCNHSLHHDHFQYFGFRDQVAIFKYTQIVLRSVDLPPSKMHYDFPPATASSVIAQIKNIAIQGYSAFSLIVERINSLSSEIGDRWQPFLDDINDHQSAQRARFREMIENIQLQLTSPVLEPKRFPSLVSNVSNDDLSQTMLALGDQVTLIKRLITQVALDWNVKVQELLHLRKKEEKFEKAKSSPMSNGSRHGSGGTGVLSPSSSSAALSFATEATKLNFESSTATTMTNVPCDSTADSVSRNLDSHVSVEEATEPNCSDSQTVAGSLSEEKVRILHALDVLYEAVSGPCSSHADDGTSVSSISNELVTSWENNSNVSDGLSAVTTSRPRSESFTILRLRKVSGSSDKQAASGNGNETISRTPERFCTDADLVSATKDSVDRGNEKRAAGNTVKTIISNLWSSAANLLIELPYGLNEHYNLLAEVRIPVVVYADEPSSIIAHALSSQEYDRKLKVLQQTLRDMHKESLRNGMNDDLNYLEASGDVMHEEIISTTLEADPSQSVNDLHIELQWSDQHAKFYCKVFLAEHFRCLRKMVFMFGEDLFVHSLSRCILWEARGGKSGSVFCKSHDDRFVLKEMSRFEVNSFLYFGPAYIQYMINCEKEQKPTVLARIIGVYRYCYKNTATNKAQKMDVLVMENLFYGRNISYKFDLKGSVRNRLVNTSGKEQESDLVLLDENLLRMACTSPLYVRPHSKAVVSRAITADTAFLSHQLIMDYSLLVGVDTQANVLVIGLIDYIRTFTWDKKLETIIKGSVLGGGAGKLPTVVSPELYRTRFCHAMDRYFMVAPSRWSGLGLGIDI